MKNIKIFELDIAKGNISKINIRTYIRSKNKAT